MCEKVGAANVCAGAPGKNGKTHRCSQCKGAESNPVPSAAVRAEEEPAGPLLVFRSWGKPPAAGHLGSPAGKSWSDVLPPSVRFYWLSGEFSC